MIRKLMASTALLALMSAGAMAAGQTQAADPTQPAIVQDNATAAAPAMQENAAGTSNEVLTPDRPTLASAFIGRSVYSSEDPESDNIGDVNDLIVSEDGSITDAVIGVGGFLGIGEKNVAVPFKELRVVERDGEIRLIYAATKEQLEAAPEFDRTAYDPAALAAQKHAAAADTGLAPPLAPAAAGDIAAAPAPDTLAMPADQTAAADSTAPAMDAEPAPADQTAAAENPVAPMDSDVGFTQVGEGQVRASALIGKEVYGAENQSIGEVSDLVLQQDGKTRVALIDVGGFLGIGEKTVAIPFTDLKFAKTDPNAAEPQVVVAMTKDQLEQLPAYEAPNKTAAVLVPADTTAPQPPAGELTAAAPATAPADAMAPATTSNDVAATAPAPVDATAPAASGDVVAQGPAPVDESTAPATTGSIAGTAPTSQDVAASKLMGTEVYGVDNKDIGEISDLVFDQQGDIDAVVVDVGGFLGIGEKPVALNFDKLKIGADENGTVTVVVDATKEQLDAAPEYKVTME